MSLFTGALVMGRLQAASRFSETFTFFSSVRGVDPVTLADTDVETVLHAGIAGRVKYPTATVAESSAAGQVFAEQDVQVHVAVGDAPLVRTDHFCRVTASTADISLVGRKFRVKGSAQAGQVTAHRYPVVEIS